MIQAAYNPSDLRYIFLRGDSEELSKLEAHLNKIPRHQFQANYTGPKRAVVFLRKFRKNDKVIYYCHSGLWHEIHSWCLANQITMTGLYNDKKFKYTSFDWTKEQYEDWVRSLGLSLDAREYQVEAAWKILKYRQSMSQLATRSGKTFMAYIVLRWMMEYGGAKNILMIVPSTQLVLQGYNDFKDYKEFFSTQTVWAKSELVKGSNLTIGTFQSLVNRLTPRSKNYDPHFFDTYDVVLCDECHKSKCRSIDTILSQPFMLNVKLRFGFSGTIPDDNTIENFGCQSLMGPMIQNITTKELIDAGYLANVDVEQVHLYYDDYKTVQAATVASAEYILSTYPDSENKELLPPSERHFLVQHVKKLPYAIKKYKEEAGSTANYAAYLTDLCRQSSKLLVLEQMTMHEMKRRADVIADILSRSEKNYIVFAHHREYISWLYKRISALLPGKKCMFIFGKVKQKKRAEVMKTMEESDNCVLFASYSCVGTGLTFKNVDYGIFAESFKSKIINKQSLGRGLLLAPDKDTFKLYDLIDHFDTMKISKQGRLKKSLFEAEGFKVTHTAVHVNDKIESPLFIGTDGAGLIGI